MKKSDVKNHYHTYENVARVIGVSPAAVSNWGEIIPEGWAYKIQHLTSYALRVNEADYPRKPNALPPKPRPPYLSDPHLQVASPAEKA
jgi:hypothetical protein